MSAYQSPTMEVLHIQWELRNASTLTASTSLLLEHTLFVKTSRILLISLDAPTGTSSMQPATIVPRFAIRAFLSATTGPVQAHARALLLWLRAFQITHVSPVVQTTCFTSTELFFNAWPLAFQISRWTTRHMETPLQSNVRTALASMCKDRIFHV